MLLPADRLLELLYKELPRLGNDAESEASVSSRQSALLTVQLLLGRELDGPQQGQARLRSLVEMLDAYLRELPAPAAAVRESIAAMRARALSAMNHSDLRQSESAWRGLLADIEQLAGELRVLPGVDDPMRSRLMGILASWECGAVEVQPANVATASPHTDCDQEQLTLYLRDRFGDPSLRISSFHPLPGGFGKQTILFDAHGRDFTGAFVLRRDFPLPLLDNDCHRIRHEYEVIRAVHARGFPAPDALWLDTEHRLLPGGDFIVMRRSPGVSGGTVIRPESKVPTDLARTLATLLARLHSLPPMPELKSLTSSINETVWAMPLERCVHQYLESWLALLQATPHLASPSTLSQLGWVLDHIPRASGAPVLLHGDLGFHNFLLDDGQLTTMLDWEFSHVGDPAEDLASVRNSIGAALDWDKFVSCYREAGGREIDMARVHFFQVWGHVRNALSTQFAARLCVDRRVDGIKFVLAAHVYLPHFIRAAQTLIEQGPAGAS
ncbi:MAG: phosphotransferase family protein [Steroidobacteraceae bacterium]